MSTTTDKAILAGGCFWGMQDLIRRRPGVVSTRVGYSGGDVANATYRHHGTHAEAIEITFDPDQTSYRDLLEFFFQIHDPTTRDRQGNDVGLSYRSAIFYTDEEQRRVAEDTIADVDASGLWPGKVVTEVAAAGPFWEAEPEHQDYLERYPSGYTCHFPRPGWVLPRRGVSAPSSGHGAVAGSHGRRRLSPGGSRASPGAGPVIIRIEASDLPGLTCGPSPDRPGGHHGIHVAVQGRKGQHDLVGVVPADQPTATWELPCSLVSGPPGFDVRGPQIHGRPGQRFIYLSWGVTEGVEQFTMFRRAKLPLDAVPAEVAAEATAAGRLVARLGLTDARGNPRCGSVGSPVVTWSAG